MKFEFAFLMFSDTTLASPPYWEFLRKCYDNHILDILEQLQNDGWEVVSPSHHKDQCGYLMRRKVD